MASILQRVFQHNLGLKLLSLGLAVVLWLAVARDPVSVVAVEVPVEFNNIPQNLEISSESIPRLQIRLRGPEHGIRRLQASDVYAEVELEGQKPGDHTFDITARQIHRPAELEVVQVLPSQLHLTFDTRAVRRIEVKPRVVGNFAQGYHLGSVVADPRMVTISGPTQHVESVTSAITDPIDVSGVLTQMIVSRHAYVSDPLIQVMDSNPVQVTVQIDKGAIPGSATNQ